MNKRRLGVLALVTVLLLTACLSPGGGPGGPNGHLLLVEVYPFGFATDGSDQYIRLYNPTASAIDLTGYALGDSQRRAIFPDGARIGARESVYVGRSRAGFISLLGAPPDFTWGDLSQPSMSGAQDWALGSAGGAVLLWDRDGKVIDQVAYGQVSPLPTGWRGAPAPAPRQGEVLDRARDESSWNAYSAGEYVRDTNTAADWKQGSAWLDLRVLRPGQTWFGYPSFTVDRLTAYASPDTSFQTLTNLIREAQRSIDITLYDLSQVRLAEELAAAARRGVRVRLLLEAESAGRLVDAERYTASLVHNAGGEVRWVVNDPGRGIYGRYVFNHAKYGIIDGRAIFAQSENFSGNGTPIDPSGGNRGWGAYMQSEALADYLARVFEADWNPAYGDIVAFTPGTPYGPPDPGFVPESGPVPGNYPAPFPALTLTGPIQVTPMLAPDHALLETKGVIGMFRGAQQSIYVQQMYAYLHWGPTAATGSFESTPNLYLQELITAARRGIKVRLLLGDAWLDPTNPRDNTQTVAFLNQLAQREGLDLQARIVDSRLAGFEKIHNKGIIVDERQVLVSSINWSYNSPANNREVALLIDDSRVGEYYTDMFTYDWYNGSAADYPLITEVNAARGYVELTHFGTGRLDIGGWSLETHTGVYRIPDGTLLEPGAPLLLATDGADLPVDVTLVGLNLAGSRGSVILRQGGQIVDRLQWGRDERGWGLPAPQSGSLCRPDAGRDTNTRLDWQLGSPAPGLAGCGL